MDRTRLYHGLSGAFGALALVWGLVQLSASISLTGGLFTVAGLGMVVTSAAALYRPDVVVTDEPATWKLYLLGFGVVLMAAGLLTAFV